MMSIRMISLALMAVVFVELPVSAADIDFPDANLDTVIREILKKKQIDKSDKTKKITDEDVATIFFLEAPSRGIESLAGLEKCRNLALIKLTGNKIKDLKPLEECVNVQSLDLAKNQIVDISPLAKLTKLQYIQLDDNQVQKLDGIQSLKALGALYLSRNQVESLQPLAELPKLHALWEHGIPERTKLSPLCAAWISEVGALNRFVHIWPYKSIDERNRVRDEAKAKGIWPPSLLSRSSANMRSRRRSPPRSAATVSGMRAASPSRIMCSSTMRSLAPSSRAGCAPSSSCRESSIDARSAASMAPSTSPRIPGWRSRQTASVAQSA